MKVFKNFVNIQNIQKDQEVNRRITKGYDHTVQEKHYICGSWTYEKMPPSLIREMHIKTQLKYHV